MTGTRTGMLAACPQATLRKLASANLLFSLRGEEHEKHKSVYLTHFNNEKFKAGLLRLLYILVLSQPRVALMHVRSWP
eukprot:4735428-Heterocapsa_arctica.AAC.1